MKQLEYNKLRNTIIENSEVIKEEVMRLEFWCEVIIGDDEHWPLQYKYWSFSSDGTMSVADDGCSVRVMSYKRAGELFDIWERDYEEYKIQLAKDFNILWKDIEIRHLLAFCGEKKIYLVIDCYWDVSSWTKSIADINPLLDLKDQDPKELEAINNYLIDNIK